METGKEKYKLAVLGGLTALTVGIHYGLVLEPIFGSQHWIHAVHGRFCYIPIVMAATWFGIRGGLSAAALISILVMPFILGRDHAAHELAGELVELVFYFAIAVLTGALVDREFRARKKQEEMRVQLERSHQLSLVGQIAAGVAHEIKNPLTSIKGALEIISDKNTSSTEKEEFTGILFSEIKRMDGTITEFLEFARPRETRLQKLNLSELLPTSLTQLEAHASARGIRLRSSIVEDVFIDGDRDKLHEMILNLVLNAIQVSDSGSSVEVALQKGGSSSVQLIITDFGTGIEEKDLKRIFEPFFSTRPSGMGLGLAIVKAIVDNHHGTIEVESKPGQGTQVIVSLPLYRGHS